MTQQNANLLTSETIIMCCTIQLGTKITPPQKNFLGGLTQSNYCQIKIFTTKDGKKKEKYSACRLADIPQLIKCVCGIPY